MTAHAPPEAGAAEFFTGEHRACDELWTAVESSADAGEDTAARAAFAAFDAAMRRHFDMEEQVLFPALEAATGMTQGPTQVMRMEHQQMRGVLSQMAATTSSDVTRLVEHGDTLLMLTQQHNVKEEGIVYPMAAECLGAQWPDLARRLESYLREPVSNTPAAGPAPE